MPTAVVFPGQASQTPEMGEQVAELRPDLIALAARLVGEDPFPRVDESTAFAQPAIFCASLVGWDRLRGALDPVAVAGHSLGEVTALVAAGAISEEDGLALVALRGRLMAACGPGAMLAALGGEAGDVEASARLHGLTVANDNAPGQLVLSGAPAGVAAAAADLRAAGVRALELNVAGAFHSPLMAAAVPELAEALARIEIAEPKITVYSCVTAAPIAGGPDEIRGRLADGPTQPVRWRETVEAMSAAGIDDFAEAGPGSVLTKLIRRVLRAEAAHA